MNERYLGVYTHIEKTAGITAVDRFKAEIASGVYMYSPRANRFVDTGDPLYDVTNPLVEFGMNVLDKPYVGTVLASVYAATNRAHQWALLRKYPYLYIPEDAGLITGHFVADQFNDFLTGRQPVRGVMLREPLDRMISQFNFFWRDRGADDWRVSVPFVPTTDPYEFFERYAFLDAHQNHQAQALGGMCLEQFDCVGITPRANEFLDKYIQVLAERGLTRGRSRPYPQRKLNVNKAKPPINKKDLSTEFIRRFETWHAVDYDLYEHAQRLASMNLAVHAYA